MLIVDEALSVGDGYFRRKCMQRIQAFLRAGGTLLLSSHAMYYVSEFCSRALADATDAWPRSAPRSR